MKKIKRLFVGICMMFMLFSSDVVAQTFVDGATATTILNQELPTLNNAHEALDKNSATYRTDATEVKRKYLAAESILGMIDGASAPSDVEAILREVIVVDSGAYTQIDEVMYNQADYGSPEVADLHSYLFGILTN